MFREFVDFAGGRDVESSFGRCTALQAGLVNKLHCMRRVLDKVRVPRLWLASSNLWPAFAVLSCSPLLLHERRAQSANLTCRSSRSAYR